LVICLSATFLAIFLVLFAEMLLVAKGWAIADPAIAAIKARTAITIAGDGRRVLISLNGFCPLEDAAETRLHSHSHREPNPLFTSAATPGCSVGTGFLPM
jgi:hypothetical protein